MLSGITMWSSDPICGLVRLLFGKFCINSPISSYATCLFMFPPSCEGTGKIMVFLCFSLPADSFATKGVRHKGWRKRAMRPYAIIHYDYIHYYVRLREGKPPKHYFPPPADGRQKIADYIDRLRSRGIQRAL